MAEFPKFEISETNRGREQIIIEKKYKYNFFLLKKDKNKVFRCTEYKTNNKCKSYVVLNPKNEIVEIQDKHNHLEKEFDASISIVKHKIKEEFKNSANPFDIKPRILFNEISQKVGFICPEYDTIKSQINRNMNKNLPSDINSFDDIPEKSEYYYTERNENFMIFKNDKLIVFQSPFQAKLFNEYKENLFADGTFYISPKIGYQVFITRNYVKEINSFYTTSFSILKDKEQLSYEIVLKELENNVCKVTKNTVINPINFHCDFERAISNAAKKVFPNINIRYCIWHYKRNLEVQKNKLCYNEVEGDNEIYIYYKAITNFPFINPDYIIDIFNKIKKICDEKKYKNFHNFLDYFKNTYLLSYDVKNWNYYDNIEHLTNNASESFNNYLNNLFSKKPTFFKLIYTLKKEESLNYSDYSRRIGGIWKKRKKVLGRTDEIDILIGYYKDLEAELIENGKDRNNIIELWFKCLKKLNNRIINL